MFNEVTSHDLQIPFNIPVDRTNSYSSKWDFFQEYLSDTHSTVSPDVLPMWVADMDFLCAPEIQNAMIRIARHGIYGYSQPPEYIREIITSWLKEQCQWDVYPQTILYTTNTMTMWYFILQALTKPGDAIVLHQPTYPPLFEIVKKTKRKAVVQQIHSRGTCPSDATTPNSVINFKELETLLVNAKILLLCNPHNPMGIVYTRDELERIVLLCKKHEVFICSDDVHSGIVYTPHRYIPIQSVAEYLAPQFSKKIITLLSPNKTFNTAGIKAAMMVCTDKYIRDHIEQVQRECLGSLILSPFAIAMLETAYSQCNEWKRNVLSYLAENKKILCSYIAKHIDGVFVHEPEATYLAWLDFSEYMKKHTMSEHTTLRKWILEKALVGLSPGPTFGLYGNTHMRLNFACSRSILKTALTRLTNAL